MTNVESRAVAVIGGGISGIQASIDLANMGFRVHLVEKTPSIGGRMAQLDKTFPTNDCAMCILAPKMIESFRHPNIDLLTYSEVLDIQGQAGDFAVTVLKKPRYVDASKCTGCEECTLNCPVQYKVHAPSVEVVEPQISLEDKEKVDQLLHKYECKRAPLIPVLQGINAEYNYVPPRTLYYVSQRLEIPLAHILRVVTFYSLFSLKPRGRHVISVCHGTSCFVRGAERVTDRLQEELGIGIGEVTEDRKFSLEVVRCIGCCALAPVLKVGERVYGKVRPKDVAGILKEY